MKLKVNEREIRVPPRAMEATLLQFLRDFLELKGAKFGCGAGLCGACTVHVDGDAVRACQIPISALAGRTITTIEGLAATAPGDSLHPVQLAWLEEAVPQCGYCQPGQIMNAVSLLARNPDPSDAEIREGMRGNICRCGTYVRIRKAIRRAAGEVANG